jgi:hypothetical protein
MGIVKVKRKERKESIQNFKKKKKKKKKVGRSEKVCFRLYGSHLLLLLTRHTLFDVILITIFEYWPILYSLPHSVSSSPHSTFLHKH